MKLNAPPASILGRIVATLLATALVVVGFTFSLVILVVAAALGVIALGYVWWKTRALRRALRQQMAEARAAQSTVIEGEATVVHDDRPPGGSQPLLMTSRRTW